MLKRGLLMLGVVFSAVLIAHGQVQSITVDQEIYSGQLDPQVVITNPATIQLLETFYLHNLPTTSKPIWPVSGPRGYRLDNNGVGSFPSSEVRVFCGVIREFVAYNQYSYFLDVNGLESFLISLFPPPNPYTCPSSQAQVSESHTSGSWISQVVPLLPTNGYEPPFNGGLWNTGDANQHDNNCYNYSANKKTGTFAQPGLAGGQEYTMFTCPNVMAAAIRDGFIPWVANVPCSNYDYKVALVMQPPTPADPCDPVVATCRAHVPQNCCDFHWLRQNRDGFWSQKHGGDPAINVDDDPVTPMPIRDPRTANRDGYTNFCAFMCVRANPNLVNIR